MPPKAVAKRPVAGTPWLVVQLDDGTHFFFNKVKRQSVKELPAELQGVPLPLFEGPPAKRSKGAAVATLSGPAPTPSGVPTSDVPLMTGSAPSTMGMGGPPPTSMGMGGPPPTSVGMGGPPPTSMGMGGPPPGMGGPPPGMGGPPPGMGGPPPTSMGMGGPPPGMGGPPPTSMGMGGPPPGMGGPPPTSMGMGGPPPGMGGPPPTSMGMGGPPPTSMGMGGPSPTTMGMGGPPPTSMDMGGPPPTSMGMGMGGPPPTSMGMGMGGPSPSSMGMGGPPPTSMGMGMGGPPPTSMGMGMRGPPIGMGMGGPPPPYPPPSGMMGAPPAQFPPPPMPPPANMPPYANFPPPPMPPPPNMPPNSKFAPPTNMPMPPPAFAPPPIVDPVAQRVNSVEQRKTKVREVLKEWNISALAIWEDVLARLEKEDKAFDLTKKQLRSAFDKYQKDAANVGQEQGRAEALQQARSAYEQLLKDAKLAATSTWQSFQLRFARDPRFTNTLLKLKEKETRYREFIEALKESQKASEKTAQALRLEYFKLLQELKVAPHDAFGALRRDVNRDARGRALSESEQRRFFRDYQDILRRDGVVAVTGEQQRELAVRREQHRQQRERDQASRRLHEGEASTIFLLYLKDHVKDPETAFEEVLAKVQKEPIWSEIQGLGEEGLANVFGDHVGDLVERRRKAFHELLDTCKAVEVDVPFAAVRDILAEDRRFARFGIDDEQREDEYEHYMADRKEAAVLNFQELLAESRVINHKSMDLIQEGGFECSHMKEILNVLQQDRRYDNLSFAPEERVELLLAFMRRLKDRGSPPAVTSSFKDDRLQLVRELNEQDPEPEAAGSS
ncbi:uncharacterized protein MONBRDRAFT_22218 [Monosiga brevicollis MX1]|uniref:FF domain-containing protein n=1 Tax=Monosiga brevicollis TaxID=81824 RepID=A9UPX1_MONBE|nr:uncharacterized protein MONBRDRAFT_22218 [Monosiga brevicollis MX1]EDQ92947.1 predicted protein [Monosiga brevicollis MX1]|eukprot:XP_001742709.1 hypothetical protein [Monosiga brevicollis MX1]